MTSLGSQSWTTNTHSCAFLHPHCALSTGMLSFTANKSQGKETVLKQIPCRAGFLAQICVLTNRQLWTPQKPESSQML